MTVAVVWMDIRARAIREVGQSIGCRLRQKTQGQRRWVAGRSEERRRGEEEACQRVLQVQLIDCKGGMRLEGECGWQRRAKVKLKGGDLEDQNEKEALTRAPRECLTRKAAS